MHILDLNSHIDLFKDKSCLKRFAEIIKEASDQGLTPISINDEIEGSLISKEETVRIIGSFFLQKPEHIEDVKIRIKTDTEDKD